MKTISLYLGVALLFLAVMFAVMYGMRWFNSTTVQDKIIQPKENVECVVVTTTDGAAVDCWKIKE